MQIGFKRCFNGSLIESLPVPAEADRMPVFAAYLCELGRARIASYRAVFIAIACRIKGRAILAIHFKESSLRQSYLHS